MPRQPNQKLKPLLLLRYLLERSDQAHPVTLKDMLEALRAQGIDAERKSVYDDLETLRLFGADIERQGHGYYIASREFELPELKLLVDAVQSCRFLSYGKSRALIRKMEGLCSVHDARRLQRQVYVANRVKTMNERVYYSIDALHDAIASGKQIRFRYFEWTVDFTGKAAYVKRYRHGGAHYQASPWALTWDNENYYLIAYDASAALLKHYRVDKMEEITVLEQARDGQEVFERMDIGAYSRQLFGMFGGQTELVRLRFANRLAGVAMDRFGPGVAPQYLDNEHFALSVTVSVSPQFFSWVFGFGGGVAILSPQRVADAYVRMLRQGADGPGGPEGSG